MSATAADQRVGAPADLNWRRIDGVHTSLQRLPACEIRNPALPTIDEDGHLLVDEEVRLGNARAGRAGLHLRTFD